MNLAAHLRIGSLEILGALAVFGVLASRFRPEVFEIRRPPKALNLEIEVRDAGTLAGGPHRRTLLLGEDSQSVSLGRSSQADVGLLDPEVSRRHAKLEYSRSVVYLSDLGSSNGTYLNGKPLRGESIEVRPGDDIDVGNTRIRILSMTAAP